MPAHARRPHAVDYETDECFPPAELLAGDRIGRPLKRRRGKAIAAALFLVLTALGGAWAWLDEQQSWRGWTMWAVDAVGPLLAGKPPPSGAQKLAAPFAPSPLQSLSPVPPQPSEPPAVAPFQPTPPAAPPTTTADTTPPAADNDDADNGPPAPLPAPEVDGTDPFQVRAAAVGLHPGISRAVLSKLSAADFKNAAYAIRTALAETPDTAVFTWPRQRQSELAQFAVRFVAGAPPGCRRYVVTINRDGWQTTAAPMEKCGIKAVPAAAAAKRANEPSPAKGAGK